MEVQISNQLALHLMRLNPDSSFCISRQLMGHHVQSGASQLINLRGTVDGQHPERHWLVECARCLRFSDHLDISMVMMEYFYGVWSTV